MRVYGPYSNSDGRLYVQLYDDNGNRIQKQSYPKYLMEQYLGRKLDDDETVHHKDGDFTNNDLDNLEIVDRSDHGYLHSPTADVLTFTCPVCGTSFERRLSKWMKNQVRKNMSGPFCSRLCARRW